MTAAPEPAQGRGIMELGRLGKISKVVESTLNPGLGTSPRASSTGFGTGIPSFPWEKKEKEARTGPSLAGGFGRKGQVGFWEGKGQVRL